MKEITESYLQHAKRRIGLGSTMKRALARILWLLSIAVLTGSCGGGAPAATPTPRTVSMEEYLIEVIRVEGDFQRYLEPLGEASAFENPAEQTKFLGRVMKDVAEGADEGLAVVSHLKPPQQAEPHRNLLLGYFRSYSDYARNVSDAIEAEDDAQLEAASEEVLEVANQNVTLGQEVRSLLIAALRAKPQTPLSEYLITRLDIFEAISPRLQEVSADIARSILEERTPANVEAVSVLHHELVATLGEFRESLKKLSPPQEALQFQQRDRDLRSQQIEWQKRWLAAFRVGDDSGRNSATMSGLQVAGEQSRLFRDFGELYLRALSR